MPTNNAWLCKVVDVAMFGLWCIVAAVFFVIIMFSPATLQRLEPVKNVLVRVFQAVMWIVATMVGVWCIASAVVGVFSPQTLAQSLARFSPRG